MECAICIESMCTKTYVAPNEEDDDIVDEFDKTCNRLKCGHAFHSSCIFTSFRAGLGCPSCRESSKEHELDSVDEEDPIVLRIDAKRTDLRTKLPIIRKARQDLNKKSKTYRLLCEQLRHDRKKCIKEALKEFNFLNKSNYRKVADEVAVSLSRVERIEISELKKVVNPDEVDTYIESVKDFDYNTIEYMRCKDDYAEDPITERFWK